MPLAIIVERASFIVWLGDTTDAPTPAVCSLCILVDEVTQVKNIVNRLLASRISKSIEKAERIV